MTARPIESRPNRPGRTAQPEGGSPPRASAAAGVRRVGRQSDGVLGPRDRHGPVVSSAKFDADGGRQETSVLGPSLEPKRCRGTRAFGDPTAKYDDGRSTGLLEDRGVGGIECEAEPLPGSLDGEDALESRIRRHVEPQDATGSGRLPSPSSGPELAGAGWTRDLEAHLPLSDGADRSGCSQLPGGFQRGPFDDRCPDLDEAPRNRLIVHPCVSKRRHIGHLAPGESHPGGG